MTLILNPEAKKAQENALEPIAIRIAIRNTIENSNLWTNIKDRFDTGERRLDVFYQLMAVKGSGVPINLNADNLDDAMTWDTTPQGHNYWRTVHYIYLGE